MIQEIYRLISERLEEAHKSKDSSCRSCAIEELSECLSIIEEIAFIYDEEVLPNENRR